MKIQLEFKAWALSHVVTFSDKSAKFAGWENAATFLEDHVGVANGVVSATNLARAAGPMPVIVELLDSAPADDDVQDYSAVVDAPLTLSSGVLKIVGDAKGAPAHFLMLAPGDYRVRLAYADQDSAGYDDDYGADHLRASIWQAPRSAIALEKKMVRSDDAQGPSYDGPRSRVELEGGSISHRCLAVVALAKLGALDVLAEHDLSPFDSVHDVYLSALGLAGEAAVESLKREGWSDSLTKKIRILQSLRRIGGERAREAARGIAEQDEDNDEIRSAADDVK